MAHSMLNNQLINLIAPKTEVTSEIDLNIQLFEIGDLLINLASKYNLLLIHQDNEVFTYKIEGVPYVQISHSNELMAFNPNINSYQHLPSYISLTWENEHSIKLSSFERIILGLSSEKSILRNVLDQRLKTFTNYLISENELFETGTA